MKFGSVFSMELWVDTDTLGLAVDASPAAPALFNMSARGSD
jgi:hypothetical protein